jgi:ribose-phosphate pyrophosphokinase
MITVHYDATGIDGGSLETMKFSAGEQFVKLKNSKSINRIVWNYEGDEELMTLGLILDIITDNKSLDMPYIPHARQDRATHCTQPYSLRVLVKMLGVITDDLYTHLTVVDPHSEVSVKLLHTFINGIVIVKEQHKFAQFFVDKGYDYVVAPDKGAANKTLEWAKVLNIPMFCCDKNRDPSTGRILSMTTPEVDLKGKKVLVVDDICDGGGTFDMVGLALERLGCLNMDLFITHGIFSKGLSPLVRFFNVYTTDSLPHYKKFEGQEKLKVFSCES